MFVPLNKAMFLDRDGVLNHVLFEHGETQSPSHLQDFKIIEGAAEALEQLKKLGYLNIVVTNQPDIAKKINTWETLNQMHYLLKKALPIDDIFVCPHDVNSDCVCRKPLPGMIIEAAIKWDLDIKDSIIVGDRWQDIDTGKKAGCTTVIIDAPYNQNVDANYRVADIRDIPAIISKINF